MDLSVGYTGIAECDSDAESCSASATTTVTFSNGNRKIANESADTNTASREYEGLHETTDSNVTSTEIINDSSASITRDFQDVEARATGTLQTTDIAWETTDSCSGESSGGSSGDDGSGDDSGGDSPGNPDGPSQQKTPPCCFSVNSWIG